MGKERNFQAIDLDNYEVDPEVALQLDRENKHGLVPAWFANEWTKAAIHAARDGLGVVFFGEWPGFLDSPWCKLELIFCQECLLKKYPASVLVHGLKEGYRVAV